MTSYVRHIVLIVLSCFNPAFTLSTNWYGIIGENASYTVQCILWSAISIQRFTPWGDAIHHIGCHVLTWSNGFTTLYPVYVTNSGVSSYAFCTMFDLALFYTIIHVAYCIIIHKLLALKYSTLTLYGIRLFPIVWSTLIKTWCWRVIDIHKMNITNQTRDWVLILP